jgi:hypothetical protein
MKRLFAIALMCAFSCCLHAQAVDTTVCEILKNPVSFNGKIVRITGTVAAGFDQFAVRGAECGQKVDAIWLSYPEGTKAKSGPVAVLQLQPAKNFTGPVAAVERKPVELEKSKDFKQFDSLLTAPIKGDGLCLGCVRYTVKATLVGRLDGVKAGILRDKAGKITAISGFGNLNAYSARLVLQSVSDVSQQEIDYSKSAPATKGDVLPNTVLMTDALTEAHKVAKVFGPGNPLGDRLERAANAFGKPGEANGVLLSFGAPNLATAKEEGKGEKDSPDGVLFNCKLNMDRLKGSALSIAIAYDGSLIADLRDPKTLENYAGTYDFVYYAAQNATLGAIGNHLLTLTLPGGYLLWNNKWKAEEQEKAIDGAIQGFLGKEELFTR